ncbi:MAG: hypothetical protein JST30_00420 [Armatimonadetes bacterium]|nr:hypothetical protein [Armatimonadota bacterium]
MAAPLAPANGSVARAHCSHADCSSRVSPRHAAEARAKVSRASRWAAVVRPLGLGRSRRITDPSRRVANTALPLVPEIDAIPTPVFSLAMSGAPRVGRR